MLVVLFDIDGTLIDGHDYWVKLLLEAVEKVAGKDIDTNKIKVSGKTDIGIFREACNSIGYDFKKMESFIVDSYLKNFDDPRISDKYQKLPNVDSTLQYLRSRGVELGIVTGNRRKSGIRKLELKGIDAFFNFEISCFSEGSETREELLLTSLKRIKKMFKPSKVYYVGDTPNDVITANKVGMLSVAVATSKFISIDALKNARPYLFLNSLDEVGRLFDDLFNEPDNQVVT